MLELPNFGHMTTSKKSFESIHKILLAMPWIEIMTSQPLFQNTFISRKPRVANFSDIIKLASLFINTTCKDSKKVKRIRNYVLKDNLYLYFLI